MLVMPAANSNVLLGYLAGRFPGRVGAMVSPATRWMKPHSFLPYAIDNGCWADQTAGRDWDESAFFKLLNKAEKSSLPPMWVVVPDVLFNRDATLRLFDEWAPRLEATGFPLALACQDGILPADVPPDVTAFVCGSDRFERVQQFVAAGFETHLGRVNPLSRLKQLHQAGVHSCDSSGWFRQGGTESSGTNRKKWRVDPLLQYLEWSIEPKYERLLFDLHRGDAE